MLLFWFTPAFGSSGLSRLCVGLLLVVVTVVVTIVCSPGGSLILVHGYAVGEAQEVATTIAMRSVTICYDSSGDKLFYTSSDNRIRSVAIPSGTPTIIDNAAAGNDHYGISCMQSTRKLYIASQMDNKIYSLQDTGGTITLVASGITYPYTLFAHSDGKVYVCGSVANTNDISVIDTLNSNTVSVITTVGFAGWPEGIAINPVTNAYYTTSWTNLIYKAPNIATADGATLNTWSGFSNAGNMVLDPTGTYLYVAEGGTSPKRFTEVVVATGATSSITPSTAIVGNIGAMAYYDSWIYYGDRSAQKIMRVFARQASVVGDPQFTGFHGQQYQVHGIPGEIFNLLSSPHIHMNSLFTFFNDEYFNTYPTNTTCQQHKEICYTHPGTYLTNTGLILWPKGQSQATYITFIVIYNEKIQDWEVRVTTGDSPNTQEYINVNIEGMYHIYNGTVYNMSNTNNTNNTNITKDAYDAYLEISSSRSFTIVIMDHLSITLELSPDGFWNVLTSVLIPGLLRSGAHRVVIPSSVHGMDEDDVSVSSSYPSYPLHGLIGQTWKNAQYKTKHDGKHYFQGIIDDYMIQDGNLLGTDCVYNQFQQHRHTHM